MSRECLLPPTERQSRRQRRPCPLLLALSLLSIPYVGFGSTVLIPASRDNTLFADPNGALSNGAGNYFFTGSNSALSVRRAVIAFDITAHLPAGAIADSVALVLNVSNAPNDTPQVISIFRVLTQWGEGTSISSGGSGAPATTGDATWLHAFYPDLFWTTAGGDFVAAASAARLVGASGPHAWTGLGMVADLQSWLNAPGSNFGWLLAGNESAPSTVRRFDSRENPSLSSRPYLFVRFTTPTVPTRTSTWGAVKSLYALPGSSLPSF